MNQQSLQEMIRLSQECLAHFWQLDAEFVIRYFDKNILWIGSVQSQYMEGREAAAKDFRDIMGELNPCHLLQQEFTVTANSGDVCVIAGRYLTTTDDEVGYFLQVQQRCTFVWETGKEGPKLKHCHISNPMGELAVAEGEKFPNAIGQMSKKYWDFRLAAIQDRKRIVATDKSDVVHFLSPHEVVYTKANRKNCVIYTTTGQEIHARMSITEFLEKAGSGFSAVHRSYALNNAYISLIQKYEVIMADGSRIPIPERRYKEIREAFAGIYDQEAD